MSRCSRETVYAHAREVEGRLAEAAGDQPRPAHREAEVQRLRRKIAELESRAQRPALLDPAKCRKLATVAAALGRSLRQTEDLFQILLPPGQAPDHSTIGRWAAEVLVAEVGTDMTQFPTAGHLCRWTGMSQGNNRSAGKRRSGRTTRGNRWLRSVLVQAAWAASHTKATIPGETYRRWVKRMGRKRALVALGQKILVLVYKLLSRGTQYAERLKAEEDD
jgi:hypothetical protein